MKPIFPSALRERLSEFVTLKLALRFAPDRWDDLERGVIAAASELGCVDVIAWAEQMLDGVPTFTQLQTLANQLTVGETYFFRQTEVFAALEKQVLPELLNARRAKRELRIWSAGCSTGEEPYSLAILLHQLLPDFAGWRIVIAGTDISTHSLSKAAKGIYTEWSFRLTPGWVKERYFVPHGARRWEVLPKIREAVRFSYLNLVETAYPAFLGGAASFDLILCRNVLMYFSPAWQDSIVCRLGQQLASDGYLLLGPCDIPAALAQEFAPTKAGNGFYRKSSTANPGNSPFGGVLPLWKNLAEPTFPASAISSPGEPDPTDGGGSPSAVSSPLEVGQRPSAEAAAPAVASSQISSSPILVQARACADHGAMGEALELCAQAIAADKLDPHPRYLRGCIFQEEGKFAEAAVEYRSVLYLDSNHVMAHIAIAGLARRQQRWALARRHYRQAGHALEGLNRGEIVADSEGLTAGRIQEMLTELTSSAHD